MSGLLSPQGGGPDEKLLKALTASTAGDEDELYRTLLVKLRYLTNGTVLAAGGVHIIEQVKLFVRYRPQYFCKDEAMSIISAVLADPKSSIQKKSLADPLGRGGGAAPDTKYSLAARGLFAAYGASREWPLDVLRIYLQDSLGPRHWVDFPDLRIFTENLTYWSKSQSFISESLTPTSLSELDISYAGGALVPEPSGDLYVEEEILEEGGGVDPLDSAEDLRNQVINRFTHLMSEARSLVIDSIRGRIDVNNNVLAEGGVGTPQSVIVTLTSFCGLHEVRTIASGCLLRLFGHISSTKEVKELLTSIVEHLENQSGPEADSSDFRALKGKPRNCSDEKEYFQSQSLIPSDMTVVSQIVKLRQELKLSQQEMFKSALSDMLKRGSAVGRLVVKVIIEDDILTHYNATNKGDAAKLLSQLLKKLDSWATSSPEINLLAHDKLEADWLRKNKISWKLLGLVLHDIQLARIKTRPLVSDLKSIGVSGHVGWDQARDAALIDMIMKILRQLGTQRSQLTEVLNGALLAPGLVAEELKKTIGYVAMIDRSSGLQQNSFNYVKAQNTVTGEFLLDLLHRRKGLSDVFWFYAELAKMLQVLMCHEICVLDKIIRDKERIEQQSGEREKSVDTFVTPGAPNVQARVVSNKAHQVSNSVSAHIAGKPSFGLKGMSGRGIPAGLTLGGGRSGIPAGLTLNKNSKLAKPVPPSVLARNASSGTQAGGKDIPVESPRLRSESIDSTDGDIVDRHANILKIKELKQQLYTTNLSIQDSCIGWLFEMLSLLKNPFSFLCSIMPTGQIKFINGTAPAKELSTDGTVGGTLSKDQARFIPSGDTRVIYLEVNSSSDLQVLEINDDSLRLWISWMKTCLCLNVLPNFKTSIDIDRMVHIYLKDYGFISDNLVSNILASIKLMTAHCYNSDVSRLSDRVEERSKRAPGDNSPQASSCLLHNRSRDAAAIMAALEVVDAAVLRAYGTHAFSAPNRIRENGVLIDNPSIIAELMSLGEIKILEREQLFHPELRPKIGNYFSNDLGLLKEDSVEASGNERRVCPLLPPLCLKSIFWRCTISCYILACSRPSSLGFHMWKNVPTLKKLMLCSISSQFDGAVSDGDEDVHLVATEEEYRLADNKVQSLLYMDNCKAGTERSPRTSACSNSLSGLWKFTSSGGTALLVGQKGVALATGDKRNSLELALLEFEKMISLTLFTELEAGVLASSKKKQKRRKISENHPKSSNKLDEYSSIRKDEDECKKRSHDNISISNDDSYTVVECTAAEADGTPSKRRKFTDPVAIERSKGSQAEVIQKELSSVDAIVVVDSVKNEATSPIASPLSQTNDVISNNDEIATPGVRRSSRVKTNRFDLATLLRSGGTNKGEGYNTLSDEEIKRRPLRRGKKKRRGKKLQKKKKWESKIAKGSGVMELSKRKFSYLDNTNEDIVRYHHNLVGPSYSTQFGSLLPSLSQDLLMAKIIIVSVRGYDRELPQDVYSVIKSLDSKYSFGSVLRESTSPDFIANAVVSDSTDSSDLGQLSSSSSAEVLRSHIARSSTWLIGTISADYKVLFRIPPLGCIHLLLLIASKLVSHIYTSGVWDIDACIDEDMYRNLENSKIYIAELKLLGVLTARLLQLLGESGYALATDETFTVMGSTRNLVLKVLTVLFLELSSENSARRTGGRLAVALIMFCRSLTENESFELKHESANPAKEVLPTQQRDTCDSQLRRIEFFVSQKDNNFQKLIRNGPLWDDCYLHLWGFSKSLSSRYDVTLEPIFFNAISQIFRTEGNLDLLSSCWDFLHGPFFSSEKELGVFCELTNLRTQCTIEALIGLFSRQPHISFRLFKDISIDSIPASLEGLLEDMLDGVHIDGLVRPVTDEGELLENDYIPVTFPSRTDLKDTVWPEPCSNHGEARNGNGSDNFFLSYLNENLIKALVAMTCLFIRQNQPMSVVDLSPGWKNIIFATMHIFNSIAPNTLYSKFAIELEMFSRSFCVQRPKVLNFIFESMTLPLAMLLLLNSKYLCAEYVLLSSLQIDNLISGKEELNDSKLELSRSEKGKQKLEKSENTVDFFQTLCEFKLSTADICQVFLSACSVAAVCSLHRSSYPADCNLRVFRVLFLFRSHLTSMISMESAGSVDFEPSSSKSDRDGILILLHHLNDDATLGRKLSFEKVLQLCNMLINFNSENGLLAREEGSVIDVDSNREIAIYSSDKVASIKDDVAAMDMILSSADTPAVFLELTSPIFSYSCDEIIHRRSMLICHWLYNKLLVRYDAGIELINGLLFKKPEIHIRMKLLLANILVNTVSLATIENLQTYLAQKFQLVEDKCLSESEITKEILLYIFLKLCLWGQKNKILLTKTSFSEWACKFFLEFVRDTAPINAKSSDSSIEPFFPVNTTSILSVLCDVVFVDSTVAAVFSRVCWDCVLNDWRHCEVKKNISKSKSLKLLLLTCYIAYPEESLSSINSVDSNPAVLSLFHCMQFSSLCTLYENLHAGWSISDGAIQRILDDRGAEVENQIAKKVFSSIFNSTIGRRLKFCLDLIWQDYSSLCATHSYDTDTASAYVDNVLSVMCHAGQYHPVLLHSAFPFFRFIADQIESQSGVSFPFMSGCMTDPVLEPNTKIQNNAGITSPTSEQMRGTMYVGSTIAAITAFMNESPELFRYFCLRNPDLLRFFDTLTIKFKSYALPSKSVENNVIGAALASVKTASNGDAVILPLLEYCQGSPSAAQDIASLYFSS